MTEMLGRTVLLVSGSAALSIAVKVTVVLIVAFAAVSTLGRSRASLRHAVLASVFGILLLLPAASAIVPPLDIPVDRPADADAAAVSPLPERRAGQSAAIWPIARAAARASRPSVLSIESLAFAVWALGAVVFFVPIAAGLRQLRVVRRGAAAWHDGAPLLATLARRARIERPVDARLHQDAFAPMTCGGRLPLIVLPATIHEWTPCEVEQALVHELEHVRRFDWLVSIGARAVCALYWWHPVVWAAWRRLNVEAERACDDAVLASADATTYAGQLVALARRMKSSPRAALGMIGQSDLSARVAAVLDAAQPRGPAGFLRLTPIAVAAVILLVTLAAIRTTAVAGAQQPASGTAPAFDVASVTPNVSLDFRTNLQMLPSGRFVATNLPLRALVLQAWRLQMFAIEGGPDWIGADRFDIAATAPAGTTQDQMRLMLRALLAERFKLRTHTGKRERSVYVMTVARAGRLGPRLRRSAADCVQAPPPVSAPPDMKRPPCGYVGPSLDSDFKAGRASMMFRGMTMDGLARFWTPGLQRLVINRTGLDGAFDGEFDVTAEFGPPPPPPGASDPFDRASFPSAFTVMREQLGLKIESAKESVDMLIIDGVEKPSRR